MQWNVPETEPLEARCVCCFALSSSPQVGTNKTAVVVFIPFHKSREWRVACAEQVYDLVADRSRYLGDAFRYERSTLCEAGREAVEVFNPPHIVRVYQGLTLRYGQRY